MQLKVVVCNCKIVYYYIINKYSRFKKCIVNIYMH